MPKTPETDASPETVEANAAPEIPEADAVTETPETVAAPETPEGDTASETPEADAVAETPETNAAPEPETSKTAAPKAPEADTPPEAAETAAAIEEAPAGDSFDLPEQPEGDDFARELFELPAEPEKLRDGSGRKRRKKRRRRKHHVFFWLFMFLTVVIAAGSVSYIYWMFIEAHSPIFDVKADVELPNLVGLRWEDVQYDETYSGFQLEMVEVYSDEVPVGQIVDQNPRAPREVKERSRIIAKVSKGVETVTVPYLVGWNKDTAREKLRDMNLTLMIRPEENSEVPTDSVIRTVPEGGSIVKAGTTITLYIRREASELQYTTVPTCIGAESVAQASIRLTQRGLLIRTITREDVAPAGTILEQSPAPGQMVTRGTYVLLTVSSGMPEPPPPPPVPPESDSDSDSDSDTSSTPTDDSSSGSTPTDDSSSGSTPTDDPSSGSTPPVDPSSGSTPPVDPSSSSTPPVDPSSGSTPPVDPSSSSTPPVDPDPGGEAVSPPESNAGQAAGA